MRSRTNAKKQEGIASYRLPADSNGVITSIAYQKRDKLRASISIGGAFAFGLNVATIERFRLRKGDELTASLLEEMRSFDERISATRTASKYIGARRRSEKEVISKLRLNGYSDEVIDEVMSSLRHAALIDDLEFSRAFIHDKLLTKDASRRELEMLLRNKGVARSIIEQVLTDISNPDDEAEKAMSVASKKWEALLRRESDTRKRSQKLYAFLASRGFANSVIRTTIALITGDHAEEE